MAVEYESGMTYAGDGWEAELIGGPAQDRPSVQTEESDTYVEPPERVRYWADWTEWAEKRADESAYNGDIRTLHDSNRDGEDTVTFAVADGKYFDNIAAKRLHAYGVDRGLVAAHIGFSVSIVNLFEDGDDTVAAVYTRNEDSIEFPGREHIPAGYVKPADETLYDAAIREQVEEMGVIPLQSMDWKGNFKHVPASACQENDLRLAWCQKNGFLRFVDRDTPDAGFDEQWWLAGNDLEPLGPVYNEEHGFHEMSYLLDTALTPDIASAAVDRTDEHTDCRFVSIDGGVDPDDVGDMLPNAVGALTLAAQYREEQAAADGTAA